MGVSAPSAVGLRRCGGTATRNYDPITGTLGARPLMLGARAEMGAATAGNGRLYTVGGWTGSVVPQARLQEYDRQRLGQCGTYRRHATGWRRPP